MADKFLVLVCFHLPVTLDRGDDGLWTAAWNDSLIAKYQPSARNRLSTLHGLLVLSVGPLPPPRTSVRVVCRSGVSCA